MIDIDRSVLTDLFESEYLLLYCEAFARRPTRQEALEQIARHPEPRLSLSVVELIREERGD